MRQQGGRRSAESGGSNVFSPQLARKSYLREESSMTKNSERAIDAKLTRRAFVGAAAATAAVGLAGCAPAATDEAPGQDEGEGLALPARTSSPTASSSTVAARRSASTTC